MKVKHIKDRESLDAWLDALETFGVPAVDIYPSDAPRSITASDARIPGDRIPSATWDMDTDSIIRNIQNRGFEVSVHYPRTICNRQSAN